jgi:protease I
MTKRRLAGKKVAFLVANDGIEQIELTTPWDAIIAAGGVAVLVAPKAGTAQAFHHFTSANKFAVDLTTSAADANHFDAVVLPGGVANPDILRLDQNAIRFLQNAAHAQLVIASICHGPWTMIEADIVNGRTMTAWPSLATDLTNAGATWKPERTYVDRNFISTQSDADVEAFTTLLVDSLA